MPGLFRIDVKGDRHFWPRRLNGREMDDIPPDQQRRSARFETIPGMPGRMAGQGHGRIPAITSSSSTPLICAAQFASTRRTSSTLRWPRSLALSNVDVASQ